MTDDNNVFTNKVKDIEGIYNEFLFKIGDLQKKQTEIIENFKAKLTEAKIEEIRNTIKNHQPK